MARLAVRCGFRMPDRFFDSCCQFTKFIQASFLKILCFREAKKSWLDRRIEVIDEHVIVLAVDLLVSVGPSFGFGFIVFLLATDMLIEALIP